MFFVFWLSISQLFRISLFHSQFSARRLLFRVYPCENSAWNWIYSAENLVKVRFKIEDCSLFVTFGCVSQQAVNVFEGAIGSDERKMRNKIILRAEAIYAFPLSSNFPT